VFGNDAAESSRLRWDWQYRSNPNNPGQEPEIWIAREGTMIIGQYATMPVKLSLNGFGDPDERRYAMKLWCRDQCAQGWTKRWADTPEEAWFEFESEMDALMFFLRWR